jgi:hypothetical protein
VAVGERLPFVRPAYEEDRLIGEIDCDGEEDALGEVYGIVSI